MFIIKTKKKDKVFISTCGCLIKTSKISKEDSIKQMVLHLKIVTGCSKDNIVIT